MPDLDRVLQHLPAAFYSLMGLSLFLALLGATGPAFFLLIVGAVVHVARVGAEGATATRRAPARR